MLAFVLCIALIGIVAWVCGEWVDSRPLRIVGGLMTVVVFTGGAAAIATVKASLSVGMPLSAAFDEYLAAATEQLRIGNRQFVVDQFAGFRRRVRVTYETELWVQAVDNETNRMQDGPPIARVAAE